MLDGASRIFSERVHSSGLTCSRFTNFGWHKRRPEEQLPGYRLLNVLGSVGRRGGLKRVNPNLYPDIAAIIQESHPQTVREHEHISPGWKAG
jgi:hypothetical protein